MKTIFILILCLLSLVSCNQSDLTKKDLMDHVDILWWRMKIPHDFKVEDHLGLRFISIDYPKGTGGGSSGWKSGEEVKIILSHLEDERIRYSIIGRSTPGHGTQPNKALGYSMSFNIPNGTLVKPGDILIKLTPKTSIADPEQLKDGELGITVNRN